jgi:hypothetical protein
LGVLISGALGTFESGEFGTFDDGTKVVVSGL